MTPYPTDPRDLLRLILDSAHLSEDAPADLFAHVRRVVDGDATEADDVDHAAWMADMEAVSAEHVARRATMAPAEATLDGMIAAARGEDLRARRVCWTCARAHDDARVCRAPVAVSPIVWIRANCPPDNEWRPAPTARNCPAYEEAP